MANVIPTREILCPICGAERETLFHLFKECQRARMIAFTSVWRFQLESWEGCKHYRYFDLLCLPGGETGGGEREQMANYFL